MVLETVISVPFKSNMFSNQLKLPPRFESIDEHKKFLGEMERDPYWTSYAKLAWSVGAEYRSKVTQECLSKNGAKLRIGKTHEDAIEAYRRGWCEGGGMYESECAGAARQLAQVVKFYNPLQGFWKKYFAKR